MSAEAQPLLSAILVTPGGYEVVRQAIDHLHAQNVRDQIEVVIVAPSAAEVVPDREVLDGFFDWQIVEAGPIDDLGSAEALGMRSARAAAVVYVEEHSYPEPGWAEALIAAHAGSWAAVGPAITNANPGSVVSWASYLLDFGSWLPTVDPGPATLLASHQTSYKRAPLLEYGSDLGRLIETETLLQNDLMAKGHRLYFEPAARTRHVNVSRLVQVLVAEFNSCRVFGARRAEREGWSWNRRLVYIAGSPLIPPLRGYRMLGCIRRARLSRRRIAGTLPVLAVALAAAALGEVAGYALGEGDAARRRLSFELDRASHTTRRDRSEATRG